MFKHYMNLAMLVVLAGLQIYTSTFDTNNFMLWCIILSFSTAHMFQMTASPASGFYTWLTIADDVFIVFAHVVIVYCVYMGRQVPRDLDAITICLHFTNVAKGFTVQHHIGPIIIMVFTMVG